MVMIKMMVVTRMNGGARVSIAQFCVVEDERVGVVVRMQIRNV